MTESQAKPYNTAEPDQDRDKSRRQKFAIHQEEQDLKKLVDTDFGRRFLVRTLFKKCMIHSSVLAQEPRIHYLTGYRDFGLELWGKIRSMGLAAVFAVLEEEKKMEIESNG